MTLLELVEQDVTLRLVSRTHGGEYVGPCPRCGTGTDRFHVWPDKGRYWCRRCSISGDTLQYYRDIRGKSFQEAARLAGKELSPHDRAREEHRRRAREQVLVKYWTWRREKYRRYISSLEDLREEIFYAETAYRSICRVPETWTEEEIAYWCLRLGDLYLAEAHTISEKDEMFVDDKTTWEWWRVERLRQEGVALKQKHIEETIQRQLL